MTTDAQLVTLFLPALAPHAPGEEVAVIRWLQSNSWRVPNDHGQPVSLLGLRLTALEPHADEVAQEVLESYRCSTRAAEQESIAPPPAPFALPQVEPAPAATNPPPVPKTNAREAPPETKNEAPSRAPRQAAEVTPRHDREVTAVPVEEPRRNYDDDVLARMILDLLRDNRGRDYTMNQVADVEGIWCHWKAASKTLRGLEARGPDVIRMKTKSKAEVFKFAPERKMLDVDYSRAEELVGGAILSFLTARPHQSDRAICAAMRRYFGYIADRSVHEALRGLVEVGDVVVKPGPRRANIHSIPGSDC